MIAPKTRAIIHSSTHNDEALQACNAGPWDWFLHSFVRPQTMKVTSKGMYKILRDALAPTLRGNGFKRTSGGMLGWYKPVEGRYLTVWFQCDKYGWFQEFGSKLTLEMQVADDPRPGYGRLFDRERFASFLTDADLEIVRALNNDVIRSLPAPSPRSPVFLLGEEGQKWFMSDYQLHLEPYPRNQDVWLHYFTPEHVETWAAFFLDRILLVGYAFVACVKGEAHDKQPDG